MRPHLPAILLCLAAVATTASAGDETASERRVREFARAGDVAALEALLEKRPELANVRDPDGTPVLMEGALARRERTATVLCLLAHGADATAGRGKVSVLHVAAKRCGVRVVRALLEKGADPNAGDYTGETALMVAAGHGRTDVLEALLAADGDVNATTRSGFTALHLAATAGRDAAVGLLLDSGADPDAVADESDTPLTIAARLGRTAIARDLLAHGADPDRRPRMGGPPLLRSAREGHVDVARVLIEHGADVNRTRSRASRRRPLHAAVKHGHYDMAALLLARGADVDALAGGDRHVVELTDDEHMVALLEGRVPPPLDARPTLPALPGGTAAATENDTPTHAVKLTLLPAAVPSAPRPVGTFRPKALAKAQRSAVLAAAKLADSKDIVVTGVDREELLIDEKPLPCTRIEIRQAGRLVATAWMADTGKILRTRAAKPEKQ